MFTDRQRKILLCLLNNISGVSGKKLSEFIGVSSRTVRSDINDINSSSQMGEIIISSRNRGYFILEESIDEIRRILSETEGELEYSREERGLRILGIVLNNKGADIYEISEEMGLSESVVYREITNLNNNLYKGFSNCFLSVTSGKAILKGDEYSIRRLIFQLVKDEIQGKMDKCFYDLKLIFPKDFNHIEFRWILTLTKSYFANENVELSDANLYTIICAIYITMLRRKKGFLVDRKKSNLKIGREFNKYFDYLIKQGINLDLSDKKILCEFFYSFNLTAEVTKDGSVMGLSRLILDEFCHDVMEKHHYDLWQSEVFREKLLVHIEYLIRRIESRYSTKNPLLEEIKKQYPYAYEISMLIVPIIHRIKSVYISDDELSYISVFVEYFLKKVNKKLNVVLLRPSNIGIEEIVKSWLSTDFQNQIEVKATIPQYDLSDFLDNNDVDLIVSTHDNIIHPSIATYRIGGIPDVNEKNALNALIHKIRLNHRFREVVKDNFTEDSIYIYKDARTFEEVIHDISKNFEEQGIIENKKAYASDVIEREKIYPTEMSSWFMIPHPLTTFASRTQVGVALLREPLRTNNNEIQVIFLLALERVQSERIGVLFQFFRHLALDDSSREIILRIKSRKDLVEALVEIANSIEFY